MTIRRIITRRFKSIAPLNHSQNSNHIVNGGELARTRITTMPNGLRVASEDSPGHFAAVGVFVDAGTRYEPPELSGISHICEKLAFRV